MTNNILTVEWQPPWWRFWNRKPKIVTYAGQGTIWYDTNTRRRVSTDLEMHLADLWAMKQFDRTQQYAK